MPAAVSGQQASVSHKPCRSDHYSARGARAWKALPRGERDGKAPEGLRIRKSVTIQTAATKETMLEGSN